MRLVIVSHPCITPANQDFFARVEERTGWQISILLPRRWTNEYGRFHARRWPAFQGSLVPLRVALAGNIPLHFYLARLRPRLRALRPDVLYVHNEPYAAGTLQVMRAAARIDGVKLGFYSAQNLSKRYLRPVSGWEKWVYRRADFALPVSAEVEDVLRGKGYNGRSAVLPLPVDTKRFHPAIGEGRTNSRPFTVGYVGRLSEEKGVDTLLDALPLLNQASARLLIVGDGPARGALAAKAKRMGVSERVSWSGYVAHDAVAGVYRDMDVVVVPSKTVPKWKEQFGRVVIEALACGVPVIASDSGELPRLIEETEGGWTFPEGETRALVEILERARSVPAEVQKRGASGRSAVERLFGIDAVAQRFATILRSVHEDA